MNGERVLVCPLCENRLTVLGRARAWHAACPRRTVKHRLPEYVPADQVVTRDGLIGAKP